MKHSALCPVCRVMATTEQRGEGALQAWEQVQCGMVTPCPSKGPCSGLLAEDDAGCDGLATTVCATAGDMVPTTRRGLPDDTPLLVRTVVNMVDSRPLGI